MAQWRKVVVSGSTAEFNHVSASGNLVPVSTDGSSLGTSTLNFSDLYLDSGAVVNFDSGDMTLTHASNEVQVSGGDLVIESTNKIGFGGAPSTDYIQKSTDIKIVAAADITLDPAGGNVKPASNDDAALGVAGTGWSDLFLAEGAVINWDSGDVTLTQTADQLAVAGGYLTVAGPITGSHFSGSADSTGSFGYLNIYGDAVIGGNITFGDANTDFVSFGADIDSNLIPNIDDTYDLGSAAQAWQDLFLEGDITLTDAGKVKATAGNLTVDSEAATLVLDGHTGVDIDASNSGKVAIDGAGGIDIGVATDVAIDIDSAALDIDSSGAITIDGTSTVSIDGADDMNFTITSGTGGEDLTIQQIGANDSSILITAAGTGTDAVSIDTTAGSMVVAPSLINGKTLTIGPSGAVQMVFTPHGTASNEKWSLTNTAGTATNALDINATAGGIDIDAGTVLALDGAGGIDIGKTADVAIDIDSSTLDIDASGALTLDSATSISIGTAADKPIDIDSTTFDVDASGALTIDSATSIAIGANADKPIDIDSTTLDIDASGAITIDSTSTILISGDGGATFSDDTEALVYDGSGNVDFDTVALDIDSSGAITIDGTSSISIDVDAASNFNTAAGDITIDSEAGSVNVDGGESDAAAVRIVASHTNGGIDIDTGTAGINVDSTGVITVGGTNATGVTIGKSDTTVTIPGSLDVNGTVTTIDSANTYIADKFMIIASGSLSDTDGGILIQNAAGAGYALGYDSGIDRWVFDANLAHNATDIGPDAYVGVIESGTGHGDNQAVPVYGGTTNGVGTIYIDTDAGDQGIWIYS